MKEFLQWSSILSTLGLLGLAYLLVFVISSAFRPVEGEGYSLLAILSLGFAAAGSLVIDLVLRSFIRSRRALNLAELGIIAVAAGWLLG